MAGVKGRSGRKRKPTALRIANGAHPSLLPQDEPQPERSSLVPPEYLSDDAKKLWATAAAQLDACGVMTSTDEPALAQYCEQFVLWQDALAQVRQHGMMVRNEGTGVMKANPCIAVANNAHDRMVKMMREFGMTPSARASVKTRGGFSPKPDAAQSKNRFAMMKGKS